MIIFRIIDLIFKIANYTDYWWQIFLMPSYKHWRIFLVIPILLWLRILLDSFENPLGVSYILYWRNLLRQNLSFRKYQIFRRRKCHINTKLRTDTQYFSFPNFPCILILTFLNLMIRMFALIELNYSNTIFIMILILIFILKYFFIFCNFTIWLCMHYFYVAFFLWKFLLSSFI